MTLRTRPLVAAVLVMAATLAATTPLPAAAHPGHGTMALVGTLATVERDAVALDVRDVGSGVVTRRRVAIGSDTKLRLKRETIVSLMPWIGASVVATVDYEEGPDGQTTYFATKIQVTPPKKIRASNPVVEGLPLPSIIPPARASASARERR